MKFNLFGVLFNIVVRIIFACGMLYIGESEAYSDGIRLVARIIGYGYIGNCIASAYFSKLKDMAYMAQMKAMQNKLNEIKKAIQKAKDGE